MSAKPQTNLRHAIRLQRCYCQPNRSFRHSPQQRHGHLQILPNQTRTRRSFTKLLPTPKRKINSLRIPQRRWRDQKPDYSQYFRFQDSPKSALRTAHSQSNPRLRILTEKSDLDTKRLESNRSQIPQHVMTNYTDRQQHGKSNRKPHHVTHQHPAKYRGVRIPQSTKTKTIGSKLSVLQWTIIPTKEEEMHVLQVDKHAVHV